MTITAYWGSGSPFAWRMLLALEFKRLPYESRRLAFDKGEHKSPEYLKLNPRGRVPALTDGECVLYESLAILAYLERAYPEPALFGRTPQEHGAVMRWVSEIVSYLEPAGLPICACTRCCRFCGARACSPARKAVIPPSRGSPPRTFRLSRAGAGRSRPCPVTSEPIRLIGAVEGEG